MTVLPGIWHTSETAFEGVPFPEEANTPMPFALPAGSFEQLETRTGESLGLKISTNSSAEPAGPFWRNRLIFSGHLQEGLQPPPPGMEACAEAL
jgi:hypothetical protein